MVACARPPEGNAALDIALIAACALIIALVLSMVSKVNVGLIGLAAAWIIGVYVAGDKAEAVMQGFPVSLFLTLSGATFLFAIGETNGTFAGLATRAMRLARGNRLAIPVLFFVIAFCVSAIGPGAIAGVALIIPLAARIGEESDLPPMLTALMVANGANAGNLSPISAVGIIANSRMAAAGLGGHEALVMLANLVASLLVAALAYAWFARRLVQPREPVSSAIAAAPLSVRQLLTCAVFAIWIGVVIFLKANIGLSAFAAGAVLIVLKAGDERAAIARMPWEVILMIGGVATLVALVETHGGTALFSAWIASIASPGTLTGVIAFVTGVISTYSSTSGVVLPMFLPMVPSLVTAVGGGDPLAVALSINVGSSLVDVSPLSTIGALCVAALAGQGERRGLFNQLLIWGFAMSLVGAAFAQWIVPLLV